MKAGSCFCLHGFTGGPSVWQDFLPEALCPWTLGHGPAPWPESTDFHAELRRLAALARSLPAPRQLLAYSQGARLGLGLFLDYPGLFDSALLISGSAGLATPEARSARRQADQNWIKLLRQEGLPAFVKAWSQNPVLCPTRSVSPERLRAQEQLRLSHTAEGLARSLEVLGLGEMPDYAPAFGRAPGKLWLAVGETDSKFLRLNQSLAASRPGTPLRLLPGVGHNPLLEAPELLENLLQDFLLKP